MLDRALAKTFASFFTLFLVACCLTVPLHEVHAYIFKDALAIRELAPDVSKFPEGRQVRGVDRGGIEAERNWLLVVLAVELALGAIVYRAARRVLAVADDGGLPGVLDAFGHIRSNGDWGAPPMGPTIAGLAFACICGWILWRIGDLVAEIATPDLSWAIVGLARAIAVGTFLALGAGTAAALAGSPRVPPPPTTEVDVY